MNKYTHHCQEKEGVCKEIPYICENIPKPEDGTEIDCSSLSDSNHICIAGPVDSDLACQFKKCLNVDADDLAIISDCSKYPTFDEKKSCQADGLDKCQEIYHCEESPSGSETTCPNFLTSDEDHACVYDGENKCEEKYYCSKVPKPADNTNSVVCTNYILSETNKDTHLCIQDFESDTYACKEEFLCTEGQGETDQECSKYPVAKEKTNTHICVLNSKTDKTCKEIELCENVIFTGTTATDEVCSSYHVKLSNTRTHYCIKKEDLSGCKEQASPCGDIEKIVKWENNKERVEKGEIEGIRNFYTNDSGINYYSCSIYNNIENCEKFSNQETCTKCKDGYVIHNNKTLCAKQIDIEGNLYTFSNEGLLIPCSSLIKDCVKCNNSNTCYECQSDTVLIDNNTCVKLIEIKENNNFFRDEETQKYVSCSIIPQCITCNS